MKTAMQELLSEMSNPNWDRLSFDAKYEMFDKLLDLEKEQICIAYVDGLEGSYMASEQYYNQTYNQNK
jgi:hypothetical protein